MGLWMWGESLPLDIKWHSIQSIFLLGQGKNLAHTMLPFLFKVGDLLLRSTCWDMEPSFHVAGKNFNISHYIRTNLVGLQICLNLQILHILFLVLGGIASLEFLQF